MISGLSIGSELKRFGAGRLPRTALIVVVLMPLLYSALYLTAFWDPFSKTSVLPVAIVNNDAGTVLDGKRLNAGEKVIDRLHQNHALNWQFMEDDGASRALADHKVHFAIRIDRGFSEAVASPTGDAPEKAQMSVTYDQSGNYLAGLIGRTAIGELQRAVADAISQESVDKVLVSVQEAGTGIRRAADGAHRLDDGAHELNHGLQELSSKSHDLDNGARKLDDGARKLHDGNEELAANLHTARAGADRLAGGIDTAAQGATQLAGGMNQLAAGVGRLSDGANQISGGVDRLVGTLDGVGQSQAQLVASLRQAATQMRAVEAAGAPTGSMGSVGSAAIPLSVQLDNLANQLETQGLGAQSPQLAELHRLRSGAQQLAQAVGPQGELGSGVARLNDGAHRLDDGLGKLSAGGNKLADGVHKLDDGAGKLADGSRKLHEGTGELTDGTGRLVNGAQRLADGGNKLTDGTQQLSSKLSEGAEKAPSWSDDHREKMAQTISSPVTLTTAYNHPAKTFGYGFAPFFIPIALFVGGIIIWLLLKPMQPRAVATRLHPLRVVFASLEPALLVATAQAAVILLVVRVGLGLTPVHPWGALGVMALSAIAFVSIIQMLNIVFGPAVGRVLSMALFMLQLTSADGIYPTEVEPAFFRFIHPFNPMSYSVRGLRQTIMGGGDWLMPVLVLCGVTALAIAISTFATYRNRLWTLERLHPPVAV